MCMYGYALNVEEGALALISWQSVPTKAPPTGGLYQRASTAGIPLEGPPEGPHQRAPIRTSQPGPPTDVKKPSHKGPPPNTLS